MQYIWMAIKGIIIGISNVIPGVSGGTMAVSLGIYNEVIHAFTHIRKEWKPSLKVLIPLVIGALMGVAGFSIVIVWLLNSHSLYTAFAFVGLILGGIPILRDSFKESLKQEKRQLNHYHILLFILFFVIVAWMGVADVSGGGVQSIRISFVPVISLFFVGVVSAAAMVIPGISGSLLMLIMGYYYAVINTINGFTESLATWNIESLIPNTFLLTVYALGMIVGIVLISKLIDNLFKTQPGYTYASILGLVLASPIAVVFNTDALDHLSGPNAVLQFFIALLLAALFYAVAYGLGKTDDSTEDIPEEAKSLSE